MVSECSSSCYAVQLGPMLCAFPLVRTRTNQLTQFPKPQLPMLHTNKGGGAGSGIAGALQIQQLQKPAKILVTSTKPKFYNSGWNIDKNPPPCLSPWMSGSVIQVPVTNTHAFPITFRCTCGFSLHLHLVLPSYPPCPCICSCSLRPSLSHFLHLPLLCLALCWDQNFRPILRLSGLSNTHRSYLISCAIKASCSIPLLHLNCAGLFLSTRTLIYFLQTLNTQGPYLSSRSFKNSCASSGRNE